MIVKIGSIARERGPYWVESSLGQRLYTLCDIHGHPVTEYGDVVKEEKLKERKEMDSRN